MPWIERFAYAVGGFLLAVLIGCLVGSVSLSGDFTANVAGATIGGLISVGLALAMFNRERATSKQDAAQKDALEWEAAMREALRYIRSIDEAASLGATNSINAGAEVTAEIRQACSRATRRLNDVDLTDIPLRGCMREAIRIGEDLANELDAFRAAPSAPAVDAGGPCPRSIPALDADQPFPGSIEAVKTSKEKLAAIMEDYRVRRTTLSARPIA